MKFHLPTFYQTKRRYREYPLTKIYYFVMCKNKFQEQCRVGEKISTRQQTPVLCFDEVKTISL